MLNWLQINDYGFDKESCNSCKYSPEEDDELIDGKPFCLKKGFCKHLKNIEAKIKKDGLTGNPLNFFLAGGLEQFEELSEKIYSLSPYDGMKLPTAMFFHQMYGKCDMSADMFLDLLSLKTNYIRNRILTERLRNRRRNGT